MRLKNKFTRILFAILCLPLVSACEEQVETYVGKRVEALDAAAWDASYWISATDAPVVTGRNNDRAADGASWFVTTVKNAKQVASAQWMTTGLGVYDLYINGKLVGEEVLKPGFTHPYKTKRSFTYDITDAFNCQSDDENRLSAQVTPGWWADKIVSPSSDKGMVGKKCAFRSVLQLVYTDGSQEWIGTDTIRWQAGIAGPVKHAAIFDGEEYDAREPMGFACADQLATPEINREFKGEIVPSDGAEIYLRHDLSLKPVQAYTWKTVEGANEERHGKVVVDREFTPGEPMQITAGETLIVDFGQNCAAVPSFVFSAPEGTRLTCLPGELLNDGWGARERGMDGPEGSVHRDNLRMADAGMRLVYTFADTEGDVAYQPRCTFFGYRYLSITATDDVLIRSIESVPVTSVHQDMEVGQIRTGNEMVNKLLSNTYWGMLSNYLSVPTDCPQRNERLGWTADAQVFAETGTFFAHTATFFHKWMRDMRDSQSETGGFPGVAPLAQYGNEMMRVGWADAGIIVPWTIWKQFGDTQIVDENWEAMEKFIAHVNETKYNHQLLSEENRNYQWADWLSYEPLETCSRLAFGANGPLPDAVAYWNYLSASYWAIDANLMADMAAATGRDAAHYRLMADAAKAYIKEQFLREDGTFRTEILNTMQTPILFALKNGLVEGEAKQQMIERLRQNFEQHDLCLQTGFLGTSILMPTLTENGMADIAYELLLQRKNPSWLYSIDNGATTIWERWNSYMADKGMGPRGMNSFNHYAYGCVCEWIWETVAGIASDPASPGFKHIVMKPIPDKRLGQVTATYHSAAGLIESSWRYEGDEWLWEFTIPEGATATVTLPGESTSEVYESGRYQLTKNLSD